MARISVGCAWSAKQVVHAVSIRMPLLALARPIIADATLRVGPLRVQQSLQKPGSMWHHAQITPCC